LASARNSLIAETARIISKRPKLNSPSRTSIGCWCRKWRRYHWSRNAKNFRWS